MLSYNSRTTSLLKASDGSKLEDNELEERLALICKKLPFPYANMSSDKYFALPALLPQCSYDNDLREEPCSDDTYKEFEGLASYFQECNMIRKGESGQKDYHDLYLSSGIFLY